MAQTAQTAQTETTSIVRPTLYVALELSKDTWKLAFTTSRTKKARIRDVQARDLSGFLAEVRAAKKRLGLAADTPVKSCYEAGRDRFTPQEQIFDTLAEVSEDAAIDRVAFGGGRASFVVRADDHDDEEGEGLETPYLVDLSGSAEIALYHAMGRLPEPKVTHRFF